MIEFTISLGTIKSLSIELFIEISYSKKKNDGRIFFNGDNGLLI